MDKELHKRLIRTAFITSPFIALYGVTPVYIFNKVPPNFLVFASIGLLVNVLVFWLVNIKIIRQMFRQQQTWKRYALSYSTVLVVHALFMAVRSILPPPAEFQQVALDKRILIAYPLLSVLAINTIVLIICNSILTSQKNKDAALEIEELRVSNLEAQKQVLIQQLQPHFLFNALSVLKSLIRENAEEAENYSVKLSAFLRYSIQVHQKDVVALAEELKFTNDYIALQKVRFENSLICEVEVPETVYDEQIPVFALQTLVENAIKHNAFTEKRPLHIRIGYSDGQIHVWNNKMLSKTADKMGTGLANLNKRYTIITNKGIQIVDEKETFTVFLHLLNGR
jgi:two-component system, LytTR family, sensor kinase